MWKKEIVILTTWDNEIYELDWNIEDYLNTKEEMQKNWKDWFFSKKYNEVLKYNRFKSEKWKTLYLTLEAPKEVKKIFTTEERKKFEETKKKALQITFEWRKKSFLKRRDDILKKLAKDEERFWLLTTLKKLDEFNKTKIEFIKLKTKYEWFWK